MSASDGPTVPPAIDPLPPAAVFAVVAGALAIFYPFFDGLTAALAALLLVSWLVRRPAPSWRGPALVPAPVLAVVAASIGWGQFLSGYAALSEMRGVLLGAACLPLWWWFRSEPTVGADGST